MAATDDDELAARIAGDAGRILLDLRRDMGLADAKALGRERDRRSNDLIMSALDEARPDDAVLSEEEGDTTGRPDRAVSTRVWVIDPLDGTR